MLRMYDVRLYFHLHSATLRECYLYFCTIRIETSSDELAYPVVLEWSIWAIVVYSYPSSPAGTYQQLASLKRCERAGWSAMLLLPASVKGPAIPTNLHTLLPQSTRQTVQRMYCISGRTFVLSLLEANKEIQNPITIDTTKATRYYVQLRMKIRPYDRAEE